MQPSLIYCERNEDHKEEKGSFLLELAITILILGIIAGGMTLYFKHINEATRQRVTDDRLTAISRALSNYAQTRFRIPCPGDPLAAANAYGQERAGGCNAANLQHGMLPYRTLGLPEYYALDGWGNRFSYVVSPNFTANNDFTNDANDVILPRLANKITAANFALIPKAQFCGGGDLDGNGVINAADYNLDIQVDQNTNEILDRNRTAAAAVLGGTITPNTNYFRDPGGDNNLTAIAVAIISHGPNGDGAYTAAGGQTPLSGNASESTNSTANNIVALDQNISTGGGANNFDDIVKVLTQEQILAVGGGGSCDEL